MRVCDARDVVWCVPCSASCEDFIGQSLALYDPCPTLTGMGKPQLVVPRLAPSEATKLVAENEIFRVGVFRNLVVLVWKRSPESTEAVRALEIAFKDAAAHGFKKVGFLTIIDRHVSPRTPPQEFRKEFAQLLRDKSDQIAVSAIVFEETGLMASVVRSLITSIDLLIKPSYAQKVFSSMPLAAAWIVEHLEGPESFGMGEKQVHDVANAMFSENEAVEESGVVRITRPR